MTCKRLCTNESQHFITAYKTYHVLNQSSYQLELIPPCQICNRFIFKSVRGIVDTAINVTETELKNLVLTSTDQQEFSKDETLSLSSQ